MLIRMLGPGGPVSLHRPASFRASVRHAPPGEIRTVWDWGDGERERVRQRWMRIAQLRRSHRYRTGGLYRLQVRGGAPDAAGPGGTRYVAVRRRGQLAASGWIADPVGPPAPFGFLITPASTTEGATLDLRCLIGPDELTARELGWLMTTEDGALHFGGEGRIGRETVAVRFRVDVASEAPTVRAGRWHLTISVYDPGTAPGRDAPSRRLSGPVRPGRVELGATRPA